MNVNKFVIGSHVQLNSILNIIYAEVQDFKLSEKVYEIVASSTGERIVLLDMILIHSDENDFL